MMANNNTPKEVFGVYVYGKNTMMKAQRWENLVDDGSCNL
jgi:hypothetical protein